VTVHRLVADSTRLLRENEIFGHDNSDRATATGIQSLADAAMVADSVTADVQRVAHLQSKPSLHQTCPGSPHDPRRLTNDNISDDCVSDDHISDE
jgi:hypothetical protein